MDVFRHEDEGMNLKPAFAAISVKSFQKEANMVLDNEQSATLPGRESNEIGSGRGDEMSRPGFKSEPQRLKPRLLLRLNRHE